MALIPSSALQIVFSISFRIRIHLGHIWSTPFLSVSIQFRLTKHEANFLLVRFLPDWFPGTKFKEEARLFSEEVNNLLNKPFAFVKQQMVCIIS